MADMIAMYLGINAGKFIGRACLAGWMAAVVAGMVLMTRYQMTPANAVAGVVAQWPANVSSPRDARRPTLIMALHPHCPCSRASVAELSVLAARADGRLAMRVLFVQPSGASRDWVRGDLWNSAAAIPGVTVSADPDGRDAAAFGATASGTVVVYGADGKVLFNGGITDGRGHEGDNPGLLAVLSLLHNRDPGIQTAPVYGCPLNSASCRRGNAS